MPEELGLYYFDTSPSSFDQLRLLKSVFESESWVISQWPDPSAGPHFNMRVQFVGPASSGASSSPSLSYLMRLLSSQTISDSMTAAVRTVWASISPHLRDGTLSNLNVYLPDNRILGFRSGGQPSVTVNNETTIPMDAPPTYIATLELLQNLENSCDLRIKFALIDNRGGYKGEAGPEEYESFLAGLPEGWRRDSDGFYISTRSEGPRNAWRLRNNGLDIAIVEHETGVEFLLGIAAGVATSAIYDLMKWGWKEWQKRRESRASKVPTFLEIERMRRNSDGTLLGSEVVRIRGPVDDSLLWSTLERMI
jgi:hypothetical protein